MSELDALQSRIMAAMERIAGGVEALGPPEPAVDPEEIAALRTALEDEKLASAQLEERLRVLKEKQDAQIEDMKSQLNAQADAVARLDVDLQRLRKANQQLRESNQALRDANEAGVGEPHLINKAMLAELEGLRATRAADVAEADAILAALSSAVGRTQPLEDV